MRRVLDQCGKHSKQRPVPACEIRNFSTGASGGRRPHRELRVISVKDRLVPYEEAWRWQQRLLKQRLAWQRGGIEGYDVLLMIEHPSVYTLGRGSTTANVKFDPGAENCPHQLYRTERGGEVTWHGPGQVVGYPILDLKYHKQDLHWYLRSLEEVILRSLARHPPPVIPERDPRGTGVWVGKRKVAAVGLNASRWVTSHGFAVNVTPDMSHFDNITPCGIEDRGVIAMEEWKPAIDIDTVRNDLQEEFCKVFNLRRVLVSEEEIPEPPPGALEHSLKPLTDLEKERDLGKHVRKEALDAAA